MSGGRRRTDPDRRDSQERESESRTDSNPTTLFEAWSAVAQTARPQQYLRSTPAKNWWTYEQMNFEKCSRSIGCGMESAEETGRLRFQREVSQREVW